MNKSVRSWQHTPHTGSVHLMGNQKMCAAIPISKMQKQSFHSSSGFLECAICLSHLFAHLNWATRMIAYSNVRKLNLRSIFQFLYCRSHIWATDQINPFYLIFLLSLSWNICDSEQMWSDVTSPQGQAYLKKKKYACYQGLSQEY